MSIGNSIEGDWIELKGVIKQQWGKLTNDEITEINGSRDKLIGKLMSNYNLSKQEAEEQVSKFWK